MHNFFEIILPNRGKNSHRIIGHIDSNGCWLCTSLAKDFAGYVLIHTNDKNTRLHRVVCETFNGPIPAGWNALHDCDNPGCCNPGHLHAGPQVENILAMIMRGRMNTMKKELTDAEKRDIAISKETKTKLAERYKVSRTRIKNIKDNFNSPLSKRMAPDKPSIHTPLKNKKLSKKASKY